MKIGLIFGIFLVGLIIKLMILPEKNTDSHGGKSSSLKKLNSERFVPFQKRSKTPR